MTDTKPAQWRQILLGLGVVAALTALVGGAIYALSTVLSGTVGGALAGGVVGLVVAVVSKAFEHQKHHEAAIAEKKREVYRRLLEPWQRVLVQTKTGAEGDDVLKTVDFEGLYASTFDVVLYGSEVVVQKYVDFRSPSNRDGIDTIRALSALLVAMREDVTGKKTTLSSELVLSTFVNLTDEQRMLLGLREYVATHPEAQRQLAEVLAGSKASAAPSTNPHAG